MNVGCVPKKVMFNTAMMAEFIHDAPDYGFDVTLNKFSWRYHNSFIIIYFICTVCSVYNIGNKNILCI